MRDGCACVFALRISGDPRSPERGAGPPVPAPARGAGSRPVTGARPGGEGDSVERVRKAASGGSLPQAYQLLPAYYHTLLKRPNIYFERESELFAR